jgi:NADH:ubiquinone oxidoreductase subunit K
MVPISHFLYLAFGLFVLGLAGAVRPRARPVAVLIALELMLCGVHLAVVTFSRAWGAPGGQVDAAAIGVLALAHAVCGGALLVAAASSRDASSPPRSPAALSIEER